MSPLVSELLLGALLLTAAGWDIAKRRIPNLLVFLGILSGLVLRLATGGSSALLLGLAGAGLALAMTFPQWLLRWMGGGDAKLMMVIGAFLGPMGAVTVLLYAMVGQGLLALGMALARALLMRMGRAPGGLLRVPMAVPIAVAAAVALRHPLPIG